MKPKKNPKAYTQPFKQGGNGVIEMSAIGVVHSPFKERFAAPRQADLDNPAQGMIELKGGFNFEQALSDLDTFTHIWVIYPTCRKTPSFRSGI